MIDDNKRLEAEVRRLRRKLERTEIDISTLNALYEGTLKLNEFSAREKRVQSEYTNILLNTVPDLICLLDTDLRFCLGSRSILHFCRAEEQEDLLHMPIEPIFARIGLDEETTRFTRERMEGVLRTREPERYLRRVPLGNIEIAFSVAIDPAVTRDGELIGVVCQFHDSTELVHAQDAAEAGARAKSAFLANMSHEIRTPLNAVIGMAELIRRQNDINDQTATKLDSILSASTHLLGLLNDVLDFSKIEAGHLQLSYEMFSLKAAMKALRDIIDIRCSERDIHFDTDIDHIDDIMIRSDELRLKQVLINLLGNAVKFTGEGGLVQLGIKTKFSGDKAVVSWSVRDSGIGMSQEQISHLFSPFVQADASITKRFGGTGLGLAISQRIVKEMGGEIKVDSEVGRGSVFSFELTFDAVSADAASEYIKDSSVPDLTGKRILIVEDVEINRMILSELLEETNAWIEEAESGEKALEMFGASAVGHYDMIFMDIQMTGIDGYETTTGIRAMERPDAKTVHITAMTANAFREDEERSFASGMNGHISKPVDVDLLMSYLNKTFKR